MQGRRTTIMYGMKSSPYPTECSTCENQGWDNYQDNFCKCPHGDKLMKSEMDSASDELNDLMIELEGGLY